MIRVDAKKRELVGNFKNAGAQWERAPTAVNDHDFRSQAEGVAILYGIFDLQANRGVMGVGVSHETSAFAVSSIRSWWLREGRQRYPDSTKLLILADTGGSNSATRGAWKDEWQRLCDRTGLTINRGSLSNRRVEIQSHRTPSVQCHPQQLGGRAAAEL